MIIHMESTTSLQEAVRFSVLCRDPLSCIGHATMTSGAIVNFQGGLQCSQGIGYLQVNEVNKQERNTRAQPGSGITCLALGLTTIEDMVGRHQIVQSNSFRSQPQ